MKKLLIALALMLSVSVFAEETVVFTAHSQNGIKFYSQPTTADVKTTEQSMSWEKFKKKLQKAWYKDEEGNWKEVDTNSITSLGSLKPADKLPDLKDLDDFQWSTNLELSTHAETKTLSKPACR